MDLDVAPQEQELREATRDMSDRKHRGVGRVVMSLLIRSARRPRR
jgi:hypothetical protein